MNNIDYSDNAIDFQKLLHDEKRRARALRQKNSQKREKASAAGATTTTTPVVDVRDLPPWNPTDGEDKELLTVPTLDRDQHCLCADPASIYYISNFLPSGYCLDLWEWLQQLPMAAPQSKQQEQQNDASPEAGSWHHLPHAKRKVALFSDQDCETFPKALQLLVDALVRAKVFPANDDERPNHILINEYTATQGILPHTDGPAYDSRTATVSLGQGQVLLQFEPRRRQEEEQTDTNHPQLVLNGGGSLVVFEAAAYLDYMHSIHDIEILQQQSDGAFCEKATNRCLNAPAGTVVRRQPRISLTVRRQKPYTAKHTTTIKG